MRKRGWLEEEGVEVDVGWGGGLLSGLLGMGQEGRGERGWGQGGRIEGEGGGGERGGGGGDWMGAALLCGGEGRKGKRGDGGGCARGYGEGGGGVGGDLGWQGGEGQWRVELVRPGDSRINGASQDSPYSELASINGAGASVNGTVRRTGSGSGGVMSGFRGDAEVVSLPPAQGVSAARGTHMPPFESSEPRSPPGPAVINSARGRGTPRSSKSGRGTPRVDADAGRGTPRVVLDAAKGTPRGSESVSPGGGVAARVESPRTEDNSCEEGTPRRRPKERSGSHVGHTAQAGVHLCASIYRCMHP